MLTYLGIFAIPAREAVAAVSISCKLSILTGTDRLGPELSASISMSTPEVEGEYSPGSLGRPRLTGATGVKLDSPTSTSV